MVKLSPAYFVSMFPNITRTSIPLVRIALKNHVSFFVDPSDPAVDMPLSLHEVLHPAEPWYQVQV